MPIAAVVVVVAAAVVVVAAAVVVVPMHGRVGVSPVAHGIGNR
jgi:hypothetical protein